MRMFSFSFHIGVFLHLIFHSLYLSVFLPCLLCTVMCLSLSLSLPLPSTTTWQINGWLPWQCNSPVTLEPLVDQNTKATSTQLSSLWLTHLKPSPTHEHRSRDKQPRIAVRSTDVHFKCLLRYCDLLMQGKMCSKTAASHWRVRHVHAWRIRARRVEEVICFPCHSWMHPAPLPTSARSKHIELIRFIYGKTDGPIIIKPRTVPFPFSNSWLHYMQEWRGGWRGKMVSFVPCLHLWSLTSQNKGCRA